MQIADDDISPPPRPPHGRTFTSLIMLLAAAMVFSYLACFAIPHVLVTADVLPAWPANDDPRPRWMLKTFGVLMGSFLLIAAWFKLQSWRQYGKVDEMANEDPL